MVLDLFLPLTTILVVGLCAFAVSAAIGLLVGSLGLEDLDEATVCADPSPLAVRGVTTPGRR